MRRLGLLLTAVLLSHFVGFAQEEKPVAVDFDAMVAELNAKCPLEYEGGWAIHQVIDKGDTSTVELMVPVVLKGFLKPLAEDNDSARHMWLSQLSSMFGSNWTKFKKQVVTTGRTLIIAFMFYEDEYAATMTFTPDFFKN